MFPRMIYRDGTAIEWEGLSLDTLVVADEAELSVALADGWRIDPLAIGDAPKPRGRPRKVV